MPCCRVGSCGGLQLLSLPAVWWRQWCVAGRKFGMRPRASISCARGLPYHLASICSGVGAAVLQIRLKGSPVIPKRSRITLVSQCHTCRRVWKEMESDYEYLMPGEKIENCVILAAMAVKSAVRFSHIQGRIVGLLIEVADCVAFVQHNGLCLLPCDRTERESRLKTFKTKVKRLTIAAGERRRKRRVKNIVSRRLQRRSITLQSSCDVCVSLGAAAVC